MTLLDVRKPEAPPRQPRVAAAARERMIVAAAIRFFAEEGFEGQVRALATRIGVKHSVLFRHFASKDALIERVYQEVYLSRWRPEWEARLRDRARPLEARLLAFYRDYTAAIFTPEWTRIFLFAGLKGVLINARYLDLVRDHVLLPICGELRRDAGLPDAAAQPITEAELELAWGLHGKIFYLAIRAFVYGLPVPLAQESLLPDAVAVFLKGQVSLKGLSSHGPARPETAVVLPPDLIRPPRAAPRPVLSRRRMKPDEREAAIVAEAVHFFAEHGMDGQLRQLAKRLGITHPLLYRYFPTKAALIERVYEEVYLRPWDPGWDRLLHDRSQPLRARLTAFYGAYFATIDRYEWIRIFLFSALRDVDISARYLDRVRLRVIEPVAAELRLAPDADETARATERVWGLHGQIVYMAIRRWVYGVPVAAPPEPVVAAAIDAFFDGAAAALRGLAPDASIGGDGL